MTNAKELRKVMRLRHDLQEKRIKKKQNKLRGISPQANYTDRATAACLRS
jgi:hypothetical protein